MHTKRIIEKIKIYVYISNDGASLSVESLCLQGTITSNNNHPTYIVAITKTSFLLNFEYYITDLLYS